MADKLFGTIETQITPDITLSTVNTQGQSLVTYVQGVPQIQTIISAGALPVASIINAPFVEVTSVNGMTGDVITEPILQEFQTNHYYLKGTMIMRDRAFYCALNTFESTDAFNEDDWLKLEGRVNTWDEIEDKPNFATVATSGLYSDLSGIPTLATVATSGLYTDLSGIPALSSVATSGSYNDLGDKPFIPTQTSDLTNNGSSGTSTYVENRDLATVATSGSYTDLTNRPENLVTWNTVSTTTTQPWVGSSVIVNGAVTNTKLAGGITYDKLTSSSSTDNGWTKVPITSQITLYFKYGSYSKTWSASSWVSSTPATKPSSLSTSQPFTGSVSVKANDNAINTSGIINANGDTIIQEYNCYGGSVTTTVYYNAIIIGVQV